MTDDVTFNDLIAFFVEVAVLVTLCIWGFRTGTNLAMKLALGVGVPTLAIGLWALFAAPNSVFDVQVAEVMVKVLVLGGGVLSAFTIVPAVWAAAFAVLVIANTLLLYVGPFAR